MSRQINISELINAHTNNIPIVAEIEPISSINNLPTNLEEDEVFSETSEEDIGITNIFNTSNIRFLPDENHIYLPMNNDFQVLINNCNEEELIDLKNQFEEKADYVLFENKILEDELKTNHVKFMDHRNSYELKNEINVKKKRKIYNYKVLIAHYINRMAHTENRYEEIIRVITKINREIEKLSKFKKFEASEHDSLCLICCDSEKTIILDCKHELCMRCIRKIKEKCPYCRRFII